ncbi:MAG: hypothetical protein K1X94_34880, partial [Sandaracinaceae bacterium]|nr:hypothetical protein [Sandaracinaceae bacterium]
MRTLIPGLAIASTFVAACGSGPRTPDAFFSFDGGPIDAPYSDAFRVPIDAYSPMPDAGRDVGPVPDAGHDAPPPVDAPPGPDAAVGRDADLMPVDNDTCDTAIVIGAGMLSADSTGAVNDYDTGTNCAGTGGPDVVYAIDVPMGAFLSVSVTSGDGVFDPSISLVDSTCGGTPRTCIDGDDSGLEDAINTAEYANTTGATARIYAVVDTYDDASFGGPFDLTVSLASPSGNDTCASATMITPGTYSGTTAGAANDYAGTGCAGGAGLDVVYALDVGAGQRATVSVTSR